MGSAFRERKSLLKERSHPTSTVVTLQNEGEEGKTSASDSMMLGGTFVFEPLPSAVHQFMRDLVAAHSDDSSFDIVVDNAKSGETAKKWNAIRRSSSRRCSLPTPTRWSSDSGLSLASSPEDTRRSLHREGCSAAPPNMGSVGRRYSLDPSDMNRSSTTTTTTATMDQRRKPRSRQGTPDVKQCTTNANYPAHHHQSHRRRESMGSTHSSSGDNEPVPPPSSTYNSEGSDSDFSDYFTSDVDELEQDLRRTSRQKVPTKENAVTPSSESALSLALISTIERLSVRAALTLCRPQTSSLAQAETMQTIDEAMELLPTRGTVTDVSTASSRSRRSLSSSVAPPSRVVRSYLSGAEDDTETTTNTLSKEDPNDPASPQHQQQQQCQHPQVMVCKQQSDLNSAMLAAIDRLSVRAALTLTNLSNQFSHDEQSGDEA